MYKEIIKKQGDFFYTGRTLSLEYRIAVLKKLRRAVIDYQEEIVFALKEDLGKTEFESCFSEWAVVIMEIDHHIKRLRKWMKPKKVMTPLIMAPSKSRIVYEPYGVCLVISPWNYPFQLAILPIIGAISAGNTVILKPSEISKKTSEVLERLLKENFNPKYIDVIQGGVEETTEILKEKYDFIFFTGSPKVGKVVAKAAARQLTPMVLELGGKSPAIYDYDVPMDVCVRRMAMAKVMNSGQTCVAPDYILVPEKRKEEFVKSFSKVMKEFFPKEDYSDMPRIINKKNLDRLVGLMQGEKVLYGGTVFEEKIEPTLLDCGEVGKKKSKVLEEEIFGPILPVMTYTNMEEVIRYVRSKEKPLALYLFSNSRENRKKVVRRLSFGGGCVNDSMMHLATPYLPFGGVGNSGQGSYHGHASFLAFSHQKSMLYSKTNWDYSFKYMPYKQGRAELIKKIFKGRG